MGIMVSYGLGSENENLPALRVLFLRGIGMVQEYIPKLWNKWLFLDSVHREYNSVAVKISNFYLKDKGFE